MNIELDILIEINGKEIPVGTISGNDLSNATFAYRQEYIERKMPAISVSLPIQDQAFSPKKTKTFFEALLPEGFTRRSVSKWLSIDEDDYLSLLFGLGQECLGAIRVSKNNMPHPQAAYEQLSLEQVRALANEGAVKSTEMVTQAHLSLAGASGKVGLYYATNGNWYLPKGSAPSTHIVKQSHIRYPKIVINEQLSLMTASELGFDIPDSFIINTGKAEDHDILFAVKRYDRIFSQTKPLIDGFTSPLRLHQEDFGQALGISSAQKYEQENRGVFKSMFELLRRVSADPVQDQTKLWDSIIFQYLIGNTDCHIKNYALLYEKNLKNIHLAPIYDVISTVIYSGINRDMPFYIGGEKKIDKIDKLHFEQAAKDAGLGVKMAMHRFEELKDRFSKAIELASEQLMDTGFSDAKNIKDMILKRR